MADWLAIYGAAIGTSAAAGVVWNIYNGALRDRARLRVLFAREFRPSDDAPFTILSPDPSCWSETEAWYPSSERRAVISVTNVGKRPLTVMEAGVEFSNKVRAAFEPGNTAELKEGEFLVFGITEDSLGEILRGGVLRHIYAMDASMTVHRRRIEPRLRPWLDRLAQREVKSS